MVLKNSADSLIKIETHKSMAARSDVLRTNVDR